MKSDDLREEPKSLRYLNFWEEPSNLRYLNQQEEPGRQSYLNQPEESGDKRDLDQRESTGDQTQLPPGDKKILVSGRDQSLVRGAAGVCGFPCMGYNSAQRVR